MCMVLCSIVPSTTIIKDGKCLMGYHIFRTFLYDFNFPYEFVIVFAIPIAISLFCYIRMLFCLRKSSKSSISESRSSNVDKLRMAQLNIFRTCLTVVGIFVLCWSVLEISVFLYMIDIAKSLQNTEYIVGNVMVLLNSIVNPYVYIFRYEDFKNELRKLIHPTSWYYITWDQVHNITHGSSKTENMKLN